MSTQELLNEIQKLAPEQRQRLLEALRRGGEKHLQPHQPVREDDVERDLFERGIIGRIPDLAAYTDDDEDFEPIEVRGKPLSETIIEERR